MYFKYAKLILPHLAIIITLTIYILIGTSVFQFLETPNEIQALNLILGKAHTICLDKEPRNNRPSPSARSFLQRSIVAGGLNRYSLSLKQDSQCPWTRVL